MSAERNGLTLLLAGLLAGGASATPQWQEGFEETFPPSDWIENSVDRSSTYAFNGTFCAKLGASGDFLITPKIVVAQTLTFWSYTTSADPDIVVEYSAEQSGPWTEFPESPFNGYTQQWNGQWLDLSGMRDIHIRFSKSGTGSLYLDDIQADDGIVTTRPPVLNPIGSRSVIESNRLAFAVTAIETDGDAATLSCSSLPPGAAFSSIGPTGLFEWAVSGPPGIYTSEFFAVDRDGIDSEQVIISVEPQPSVLISEIADPAGTGGGELRFVELYNAGSQTVDLGAGNWELRKQVNGGSWSSAALTNPIAGSAVFVIAFSAPDFEAAYGRSPDLESSVISGTGNDGYFLFRNGVLIDSYGREDQDGTGEAWDYTDSRAVRADPILRPRPDWTAEEWVITADASPGEMTPGMHGPLPQFDALSDLFVFSGNDLNQTVTAVNTVRTDTITLSAKLLPPGATLQTATGTNRVSSTLFWPRPQPGTYRAELTAAGSSGMRSATVTITVSSHAAIDGDFAGWDYGTIVKLDNGQFWRNIGGTGPRPDPPLRNPTVTVTNWLELQQRMAVDGLPGFSEVERIEIEEATVMSPFNGLAQGNVYELSDQATWKQISFEQTGTDVSGATAWRHGDCLIFVDRHHMEIGRCTVVPAQPPADTTVRSRLDGAFHGWQKGRVYALENGQVWQQTSLEQSTCVRLRPDVTISDEQQMRVEGEPLQVEVRQLTNATHTAIDGLFSGFKKGAIFQLKTGAWIRQVSSDQSAGTHLHPAVFLWNDNRTELLQMPSENRTVEVEPLNVLAESSITNAFNGLHHGTVYELENGRRWMQISFENRGEAATNPSALIWLDGQATYLLARNRRGEEIGVCRVAQPEGDEDGDGRANAAEAVAGSDPLDSSSSFRVSQAEHDGHGNCILHWNPAEGRMYSIEWTPALTKPFQPLATGIAWPQNGWTNSLPADESEGFYRITVQPE